MTPAFIVSSIADRFPMIAWPEAPARADIGTPCPSWRPGRTEMKSVRLGQARAGRGVVGVCHGANPRRLGADPDVVAGDQLGDVRRDERRPTLPFVLVFTPDPDHESPPRTVQHSKLKLARKVDSVRGRSESRRRGSLGETGRWRSFPAGSAGLGHSRSGSGAGVHPAQDEDGGLLIDPELDRPAVPEMALPNYDATRGRELFVTKGCVVCHAVNDVGGDAIRDLGGDTAPPLDASRMPIRMDPFIFFARMWRGAQTMIALQEQRLGYQIALDGAELADIMAFIYDFEAPGGAFPSSHIAVALCTVWFSWRFVPRIRYAHLILVILLCLSTIYCRYHYAVDVLGGILTAAILVPLADGLHRRFP